jgi:hypothetical protein
MRNDDANLPDGGNVCACRVELSGVCSVGEAEFCEGPGTWGSSEDVELARERAGEGGAEGLDCIWYTYDVDMSVKVVPCERVNEEPL